MAVSFLMGLARLRERLQGLGPEGRALAAERSVGLYLLENIEGGKPSAIPFLYLLVFDPDARIAQEAVTAIGRLTTHFSASDWRWLEGRMRSSLTSLTSVKSHSLPLLARFGSRRVLLLGLASFERDGHIREAAVKELAALSDGELPFLLMRLNDWVPQVSEAAHAACMSRLISAYAVTYLANLPYVLALSGAGRRDFSPFIRAVEELLTRPECRPALTNGLASADPLIRRTCFRLALSLIGEDMRAAFAQAFQSRDPIVRRQAARLLRERPAGDAVQEAFLTCLRRDSLASIRREYLYLCHEKYPERATEALRSALLDPHPSVRSVARYYLPLHEPSDFRRFYIDVLESSDTASLAVVILGIGETGGVEDAASVSAYLNHSSTAVRQAAVTALGRLNGDAALPELLAALNDARSPVSRVAREALLPRVFGIDDDALWVGYCAATMPHMRRNALCLMLALPKWRGGVLLVQACAWSRERKDEAGETQPEEFLKRWLAHFDSSALRPAREQLAQMQQAAETEASVLDRETLMHLREVLRYWERLTP